MISIRGKTNPDVVKYKPRNSFQENWCRRFNWFNFYCEFCLYLLWWGHRRQLLYLWHPLCLPPLPPRYCHLLLLQAEEVCRLHQRGGLMFMQIYIACYNTYHQGVCLIILQIYIVSCNHYHHGGCLIIMQIYIACFNYYQKFLQIYIVSWNHYRQGEFLIIMQIFIISCNNYHQGGCLIITQI